MVNWVQFSDDLHSYNRQPDAQYYTSQTSLDRVYVSQTSLNRVPGIQQEYGYVWHFLEPFVVWIDI